MAVWHVSFQAKFYDLLAEIYKVKGFVLPCKQTQWKENRGMSQRSGLSGEKLWWEMENRFMQRLVNTPSVFGIFLSSLI